MLLTNKIREEFVERVMNDVPKIDYKTQAEDLVRKELVALRKAAGLHAVSNERLSPNSVTIDTYRHKETKIFSTSREDDYFNYSRVSFISIGEHGLTYKECRNLDKHQPTLDLLDKFIAQANERVALSNRIRAVINSCNTLKQATDALPEFVKYLPKETPKAGRTLPVVGNLVAELTKKGWPESKKAASKSK